MKALSINKKIKLTIITIWLLFNLNFKQNKIKICPNYILETVNQDVKNKSFFTASDIFSLRVIKGRRFYNSFITENTWISNYLNLPKRESINYKKGKEIRNLPEEHDGFKVFHAGTELINGDIRTNGGRVLCITALGNSVQSAQKKAYSKLSSIKWDDSFYREDIGYRAIEREKNEYSW